MPDAIVIGGGVIGMLCARELKRRGLDVTLVERDRPGKQASWASAGILTAAHPHDTSPESYLKRRSQELYPALVADLKEEADVDPEMTLHGHLVPAFSDQQARELQAEARQDPDAELVQGAALREAEPALGPSIVAGAAASGRPDRQPAAGPGAGGCDPPGRRHPGLRGGGHRDHCARATA